MQTKYDPHKTPDSKLWLSVDESERLHLVEEYHRKMKIEIPDMMLHSAIHTTIENQIAMGDELPVRAKLEALMVEGLDRHDAIHAIGSVLAEHLYNLVNEKRTKMDPHERYFKALASLTAESWMAAYEDMEEV
jgi:hypothetical protein